MRLPKLGKLIEEAKGRKEVWAWDGVVPANDLTLVAAFMKKGKTTLLTGLVNGWLKKGAYCGRGAQGVRKVLYLAPEEGDTLVRRFERLGFTGGDEPVLVVVPRGAPVWAEMVSRYRMREWGKVVEELREEGFDGVVMDGLHTLLQMFEPQAKEDNEGVGKFMTHFVLPFGGMTVVAALHTKKGGGDPRVRVPPEEMIRGASAWSAHPGQILVMEHLRKEDLKRFHAFGRYEGSTAQGMTLRYDTRKHDYVEVVEDSGEAEEDEKGVGESYNAVKQNKESGTAKAIILKKIEEAGTKGIRITMLFASKITKRNSVSRRLVNELVEEGKVVIREVSGNGGVRKIVMISGNDEEVET